MVGELRVLRVALALPAVVEAVQVVVLVDRPLRGRPVVGGNEEVLARRHQALLLLGGQRLALAAARHGLERRRGAGQLGDALAQPRGRGPSVYAARRRLLARSTLA